MTDLSIDICVYIYIYVYIWSRNTQNWCHLKKISDVLSVSVDTLLGLDDEQPINTIAAHFDGTEFTDTELDDIANYIEFVKSKKS